MAGNSDFDQLLNRIGTAVAEIKRIAPDPVAPENMNAQQFHEWNVAKERQSRQQSGVAKLMAIKLREDGAAADDPLVVALEEWSAAMRKAANQQQTHLESIEYQDHLSELECEDAGIEYVRPPYINPCDHARLLLESYFSLSRTLLGDYPEFGGPLMAYGWTVPDHCNLIRILADGCHNFADIAFHDWDSEKDAMTALRRECRWLYARAETMRYPAGWDRDPIATDTWRAFWNDVARPLRQPPRYGVPFEAVETQHDAHLRLYLEAESRDLLRPPMKSRLATLILGLAGKRVLEPPRATRSRAS